MPTYKNKLGYSRQINGVSLPEVSTGTTVPTYTYLPSDETIEVISASPAWSPVLLSQIVTVNNEASSTITVPRPNSGYRLTLRVMAGQAKVVFNSLTDQYLILPVNAVWERYLPKALLGTVTITGMAAGTQVYVCVEGEDPVAQ